MHGACYRKGNGQPYANTRHIKGKPQIKIAKFNSGNKKRQFEYCVQLKINEKVQIRHMALESTRLAANKTLEKTTGESGYNSRLRVYPHIPSSYYCHDRFTFYGFLKLRVFQN